MLPEHLPHYLSPAKLNLDLRIVGRRDDGYHELESIFTLIDLYDTLCIVSRDDGQIVLHTPTKDVLPEEDLTVRSARVLQQISGSQSGADIWLDKNIPMGGGLGGGSSNAATVLLVLNQLWRCGLSQQQLIDIGVTLGADVPFFIFGQTAFVRGIGEQLQPFDIPKQYYVLVYPNEHVATAKIFASSDLPRNSERQAQPNWVNLQPLRNDMQEVVLRLYPRVQEAFDILVQYGSPRMTGSGACLFLSCETREQAENIAASLPKDWQTWCVSVLNQHPLFHLLSNR